MGLKPQSFGTPRLVIRAKERKRKWLNETFDEDFA